MLVKPFCCAGLEGDHCGEVGLYAGDAGARNFKLSTSSILRSRHNSQYAGEAGPMTCKTKGRGPPTVTGCDIALPLAELIPPPVILKTVATFETYTATSVNLLSRDKVSECSLQSKR